MNSTSSSPHQWTRHPHQRRRQGRNFQRPYALRATVIIALLLTRCRSLSRCCHLSCRPPHSHLRLGRHASLSFSPIPPREVLLLRPLHLTFVCWFTPARVRGVRKWTTPPLVLTSTISWVASGLLGPGGKGGDLGLLGRELGSGGASPRAFF